jgi:integrase/recombinase XerD
MKPKITPYFDKRKPLKGTEKDPVCHLKIMVTFYTDNDRIRRYYQTDVFCTESEWKLIVTGKFGKRADKETLEEKRQQFLSLESKAKDIANDCLNPDDFESRYYSKGNYSDPISYMLAYSAEMEQEGRIGNRDYYRQAASCWKRFADEFYNGKLLFAAVSPKTLMRFENWLLNAGRSLTTVAMYAIAMRTIFNLATSKGTISKKMYPFGKGKYQIPSVKGRKMALTGAQKDKILKYKTLNPMRRKAVDMWLFSFFSYGMNFGDMLALKYSDIEDNYITFDRAKTKRTERIKEYIPIEVRKELWDIIERWGNPKSEEGYIFPVLNEGLNASQIKDRIHDFIKDTNSYLAEVCDELHLPKITTYWARHTFATIMRNKGVSIAMIQKMMGHASETTTQNYFGGFEPEMLREATNNLFT